MAKRKKNNKPRIILSIVLLALFIAFVGLLFILNLIPAIYFWGISIILAIISVGTCLLMLNKKGVIGIILAVPLAIIYLVGSIYLLSTIIFFNGFGNEMVEYNYKVLVLNTSKYDSNKSLKDKIVYLYADSDENVERINKKVKYQVKQSDDFDYLLKQLNEKKIDAILVENGYLDMLIEEDSNFLKDYKVIDKVRVTKIIKRNKKGDITKKPFNVLITGIDTTGKVSGVARSDVNILVSVNPKKHEMLLTSIPRDYYVEIKPGKTKDKLTHSGIYGVDTTMYAVSNLLDTEIDYYIKVNFTSLVDIVDTLGGIEIISDTTFTSGVYDYNEKRFTFKEGKNKVNGKQALAFARERKSFYDGDRRRNMHQQEVIKGILNKALEPQIIIKYNSLLSTLSNSFVTNINSDDIKRLIKNQVKDNKKWTVENSYLTGSDSYQSTYSYKSKLYVMMPDEKSVQDAQNKIKDFFK